MKNIKELRDRLSDVFNKIENNKIDIRSAEAMNNTAGKMIKTVMLELKQIDLTNSKESIPFLEYDKKK